MRTKCVERDVFICHVLAGGMRFRNSGCDAAAACIRSLRLLVRLKDGRGEERCRLGVRTRERVQRPYRNIYLVSPVMD